MTSNLIQILHSIHHDILSVKRCGPDIHENTPIELADGQPVIQTGVIYLVTSEEAPSFLSNALIHPGACLFISDVAQAGRFTGDPLCDSITVVECGCHFSAMFNRLTKAMSQHFRNVHIDESVGSKSRQDQLHTFWKQIRNRTLQGTLEIKEQLRQIVPDFKAYIRLIVIVSKETPAPQNWAEALGMLQAALPNSCLFFSDGEVIGFQFFDKQTFGVLENQAAMESILAQYDLSMMVSNSTRDFSKLNTLYSLTHRAGLVAQRLNIQPNERIYHYERYSMYQVIDLCTQRYMSLFNHSDIIYLVHPIVVHLTRYDEKNRTNLRDVLFYYLQNSQDLKHTAEVLYMHRNTVSNKINQIRNICNVDFEDGGLCQRLLFSCQVMLYYERVLQQRVMRNEEHHQY